MGFVMRRLHILITAGGTREAIDPVRFLSNGSSGRMGVALARAAKKGGHKVTLISAPIEIKVPRGIVRIPVVSAADMFTAVKKQFHRCDCLIMAAAVSDYTPIQASRTKRHKGDKEWIIRLKPTTDILAWAGCRKRDRILVGFALEDQELLSRAEDKMVAKNLDLIVANSPQAIGQVHAVAHIKLRNLPWIRLSAAKSRIAEKVIRMVERIFKRSE